MVGVLWQTDFAVRSNDYLCMNSQKHTQKLRKTDAMCFKVPIRQEYRVYGEEQ